MLPTARNPQVTDSSGGTRVNAHPSSSVGAGSGGSVGVGGGGGDAVDVGVGDGVGIDVGVGTVAVAVCDGVAAVCKGLGFGVGDCGGDADGKVAVGVKSGGASGVGSAWVQAARSSSTAVNIRTAGMALIIVTSPDLPAMRWDRTTE